MLVIYDLWLLIIGWGMFLNNMKLLACLMFLIGLNLFIKSIKKMNCWRFMINALIIMLFNIAVSYLASFNKDLLVYTFLILQSLLTSLTYELIDKTKLERLLNIYFVVSISFLSFLLIANFIPDTYMYLDYKLNIFVYIMLIFIPSFLIQSIQILIKLSTLSNKMKIWNH